MSLLFILMIPGILGINNSVKEYFSIQSQVLILGPQRGLLSLISGHGDWPSFINYTQDIDDKTGLNISMGFTDDNVSLNYDSYLVENMDICHVLDNAVNEPESPQNQFMIPEMIGLYGLLCPIKKGVRNLQPYKFPTISKIEDLGVGEINFVVKIVDIHNSYTPLITVVVPLDMKYWNEEVTCMEESSASIFAPKFLSFCIATIVLLVAK